MTPVPTPEASRWENYVLESGSSLVDSWQAHLKEERHLLFLLGRGFDPRMCLGLETLLSARGAGRRDVVLVEFDEGEASPSKTHEDLVDQNSKRLSELCDGRANIIQKPIRMWSEDGRRIGARSAAALLTNAEELAGYDDIIVDISALPRGIYFPLVAKVLHLLDEEAEAGRPAANFHVFISEDPSLDRRIRDEGIDETASYLHPFSGGLEIEATAGQPKVWIPLLGEDQEAQLIRIYDLVQPDEICPLFPSPSLDPRRTDNLVLEYRDLLFDRLRVEAGNFLYASERNPFEVYRQIRRTVFRYREVLQPLGGSKTVVSALSSKLLSVGALLVAYELKRAGIEVGVAHVEAQGYVIAGADQEQQAPTATAAELFGLWLGGECYAL